MADQPNIVLAHGAWADGSSWSAVIESLQAAGYRVTALQFPLTRLADDVARLRRVLARQDGPTVVAGHSYGCQIITALGEDAPIERGSAVIVLRTLFAIVPPLGFMRDLSRVALMTAKAVLAQKGESNG